jgi:putative transposase
MKLFGKAADYQLFEQVLTEAVEREGMRLCAYVMMPNHFHLVLWPRRDGQLSRFMQWVTMTHTQRFHARRGSRGRGHLYQSRFKSFPIQADEHFLSVCRYVERNPLRAGLVRQAKSWAWSSLGLRQGRRVESKLKLAQWPVAMPRNWSELVERAEDEKELEGLRRASERGRPFGEGDWVLRTATRLGIQSSLRPPGRPRKSGGKKRKGL